MRYEIKHGLARVNCTARDGWFESFQVEANTLPRRGEAIEIDGTRYQVVQVLHGVRPADLPGVMVEPWHSSG